MRTLHKNKNYPFFKVFFFYVLITFLSLSNTKAQENDTLNMDSLHQQIRELSYGNQDSSIKLLDGLISTAKKNNYYLRLGTYYCQKGRILLNNESDLEESLKNFLLAAEINKKAKSHELELAIKDNLAFYYCQILKFDEAKSYVYYLINNYTNCTNTLQKAKIANTIGNYYSDLTYYTEDEYLDSALFFFNKSLNIAKLNNLNDVVAANYISIGIAYYDKGKLDDALEYYLLAEKASLKQNDTIGVASIKYNIGSIYFDKKEYKKAINYYNESKGLYYQFNKGNEDYRALFMLASVYAKINNYEAAYNNYKLASEIHDSTYNLEKEGLINDLLIQYETKKKENEILIKNKKIEAEKTKSKNRNIIILGMALLMVFILLIGVFVIQNIKNKNKLMAKEVELKNEEINKILKEQEIKSYASLLEGQDKERQRIASELHDRLGGLLSTIKAYFSVIEEKISSLEDKTIQQHETASNLLNTAVDEVRNISHDLHSGVLKNFGLGLALQDLKSTIELSGSLKVELSIHGEKQPLTASVEIEIYRIIQELFSNTMKHAKANLVTLQIVYEESQLNIIFEDDGIGFNPTLISKGIGLKNIEARVKKLHGNLNIDSRIGRGTITIIEMPVS